MWAESALAAKYDRSYTSPMKTAISIPDPLFKAGERAAKREKISRSRLYAKALKTYLQQQDDRAITEALNAIYSTEESALEPDLAAAAYHVFAKERW